MNSQQQHEPLRALISRICRPGSAWTAPVLQPAVAEQCDAFFVLALPDRQIVYRRADIECDAAFMRFETSIPKVEPVAIITRKSRAELDTILWPPHPTVMEPEINEEQFAEANRVLSDPEATIEANEAAGRTYWRYVFQEDLGRPEYDDSSSD